MADTESLPPAPAGRPPEGDGADARPGSATLIQRHLRVPVEHPAFAGHFPGRPILPGVALLAEVVEALRAAGQGGDAAVAIQGAKFLAPVGPGAELTITLSVSTRGGWRFEVHADGVLAASGSVGAAA